MLWYALGSVDAKTIIAEFHYYHNDFLRCHEVTGAILARDSFAHPCLGTHIHSAVIFQRVLCFSWPCGACKYMDR